MQKYKIDICALQECKIKNGTDERVGAKEKCRLITFPTTQKHYGNGFITSPQIAKRIYKCWKVDDRICVMQLNMDKDISDETVLRSKYMVLSMARKRNDDNILAPKKIMNVINVYAPTTSLVSKDPKLLDKIYQKLSNLLNEFKGANNTNIIMGDFNAKIGIKDNMEKCVGRYSRGRRNNSGQLLINFCEIQDLYVANSAFKHPARHITTYSKEYVRKETGEIIKYFSMIDYILVENKLKHILRNSRSYAGTITSSDHRLVVAELDFRNHKIHKPKTIRNTQEKKFHTSLLIDSADHKKAYQDELRTKIEEFNTDQPEHLTQSESGKVNKRWLHIEKSVRETANSVLGEKPKIRSDGKTHSEAIDKLSKQSRDIRLKIQNLTDTDEIKKLKQERNKIAHAIRDRQKFEHNARINDIVEEIADAGKAGNSKQMYAAVKNLNRKSLKELTVKDKDGKTIVAPTEVYNTITDHYQSHFKKENHHSITRFPNPPAPLENKITAEEVQKALSGMTNGRAAYDNISAELLKYAPERVHQEIATSLNEFLEDQKEISIGDGKICPLEKPKKPMPGPAKDLRPIVLLRVIRKCLSKITLIRLKPAMEAFLSPSQSAYRNGRSTTDIVWSYRWILAKVTECNMKIFSTGIDMTAAFDTIDRETLIQIIEEIADSDTARMVRALLSDTVLEVRMLGTDSDPFKFDSNIGSPQGDSLSGPLFIIYFEYAMRKVRDQLNATPAAPDHQYISSQVVSEVRIETAIDHEYPCQLPSTHPPEELTYADDADKISLSKEMDDFYNNIVSTILGEDNLQVNNDKTERLILQRGDRDTEQWRESLKLGSYLGDTEDILRRKQLALAAFNKMKRVWLDKQKVTLEKKIDLLESLVMSIFFYNCSCWGLRKSDLLGIESFHRQLLRYICNIKYPEIISNSDLYKKTKCRPAQIRITISRWRYLGHALRLPEDTPPQVAMSFFFSESKEKKHRGKRCTIVTTLQEDIVRTKRIFPEFQIQSLQSYNDLVILRQLASDRKGWRKISKSVVNAVEAERQPED